MNWKSLGLIVILVTTITLVVAPATFSRPISPDYQQAETINPNLGEPVCYIQTEDGRVLELSQLCGKEPVNSTNRSNNRTYPQPPNVYNMAAMQAFDNSLYGQRK